LSFLTNQLSHHIQHFSDHLRVQRGRWLIEQHDFWPHGQRSRNRYALLLAAGELSRELVRLLRDANTLEKLHSLGFRIAL
jgi:hypothetical protein